MEQLQLMMKQRHERRKARREARLSPYPAIWNQESGDQSALSTPQGSPGGSPTEESVDLDAKLDAAMADQVAENSGYAQIQTETVVAWALNPRPVVTLVLLALNLLVVKPIFVHLDVGCKFKSHVHGGFCGMRPRFSDTILRGGVLVVK